MAGFAACSSDAKKADTTTSKSNATTTVPLPTTTTTVEATSTTETPDATDGTDPEPVMTDAEFATAADDLVTGVEDSSGICDLDGLLSELVALNPTTKAQVKDALKAFAAVFGAIADAAPAGQEANAKAIRDYVAGFAAKAKAVDYDPDQVDADDTPAFDNAMDAFTAAVESAC